MAVSRKKTLTEDPKKEEQEEELVVPDSPSFEADDDNSKKRKPEQPVDPSIKKRNKDPGVRLIGGRIYDSENGKTCHQCRQKTRDFMASCKGMKGDKQCKMCYCHKCLLNRYGEKAEEVNQAESWMCPKCRGDCNCSFCRKKRGQQPTGILFHTAKATGFSSVSDLLHVHGFDLNKCDAEVSNKGSFSPLKSPTKSCSKDGAQISESSTIRKYESIKNNENGNDEHVKNSQKELNQDVIGVVSKVNSSDNVCGSNMKEEKTETDMAYVSTRNPAKPATEKFKKQVQSCAPSQQPSVSGALTKDKKKVLEVFEEKKNLPTNNKSDNVVASTLVNHDGKPTVTSSIGNARKRVSIPSICDSIDIVLPQGAELETVAGFDLPMDDIGPVLQFLEFCAAFREVLDLNKSQAESVLRELTRGRIGRRGVYSSVVQFHVKLLELLQRDAGEEPKLSPTANNSWTWLKVLQEYLSESYSFKDSNLDFLNKGSDGYEKLEISMKLRILNFLCDEVLETEHIRNWIDDENSKFLEMKREDKENLLSVKEKEKNARQKLKDELARRILSSKDGLAISIIENEEIVSKIRKETIEAQAERLKAIEMSSKLGKQRADAVRTESLLIDQNGRTYWRLKGHPNIIIQEVGSWDLPSCQDKWYFYNDEQENVFKKHATSLRKRRRKVPTISEVDGNLTVQEQHL